MKHNLIIYLLIIITLTCTRSLGNDSPISVATSGEAIDVWLSGAPDAGMIQKGDEAEIQALALSESIPLYLARGQILLWGSRSNTIASGEGFWSTANLEEHWFGQLIKFPYGAEQAAEQIELFDNPGNDFITTLTTEELLNNNHYGLIEIYQDRSVADYVFLSDSNFSSQYNPDPQRYILRSRFYFIPRDQVKLAIHAFPTNLVLARNLIVPPIQITAVAYHPNTRITVPYLPLKITYPGEPQRVINTNVQGELHAELRPDQANMVDGLKLLNVSSMDKIMEEQIVINFRAQAVDQEIVDQLAISVWILAGNWQYAGQMGSSGDQSSLYPDPSDQDQSLMISAESHIREQRLIWSLNQLFTSHEKTNEQLLKCFDPGRLIVIKCPQVQGLNPDKLGSAGINVLLEDTSGVQYRPRRVIPHGVGFYVPANRKYRLEVRADGLKTVSITDSDKNQTRWLGDYELNSEARSWEIGENK